MSKLRPRLRSTSSNNGSLLPTATELGLARDFTDGIVEVVGAFTADQANNTGKNVMTVFCHQTGASVTPFVVFAPMHVVGFQSDSAALLSLDSSSFLTQDALTGILVSILCHSNSSVFSPRLNIPLRESQIVYFVSASAARMIMSYTLDSDITS